jgi:CPA2 family monovalent cation:H+ antiporter-2
MVLGDVMVFLLAAVLAVVTLHRLGWSPVVGYLIAGAVIGPFGLGLVKDDQTIRHLAEFGVIFLMFTIGLELSFERLKTMRRDVFGLGGAQVIITMLAVAAGVILLGKPWIVGVVIGGALALSSTAVVLQLLIERDELASRVGRKAFSILLFQDLAVVPLLLMVSLLAGEAPSLGLTALLAVGEALVAIVLVLFLGRLVLRPLFRAVAATRSSELFTAVSFLTLFGIALIMEAVGLSMALGAFLAGLLLAETEYRQQIEMDIEPYKGLLLALFFMTVGMGLDWRFVVDNVVPVLLILGGVLVLKALLIAGLGYAFRLNWGESARLGLLLAQTGEFAFVILGLAVGYNLVESDLAQLLFVATGLSIAITPALMALGHPVERAICGRLVKAKAVTLEEAAEGLEGHVVIAGFGRVGRAVCRLLRRHKVPFVALDMDPHQVSEAFKRDLPVFFGNASRADILKSAGLKKALAVVITLDQPAAAGRAVQAIRNMNRDVAIFVRARDNAHGKELERLGATSSVAEATEGSLQLAGRVLEAVGTPADVVNQTIAEFRRDDYALLEAEPGATGES